ncbi:MAG TPA: type II secretion system protein GspL [Casimicrobiaceae bacterium]|nr:type II secretion system protein GspL [Casimicrobiaceae bacterium]
MKLLRVRIDGPWSPAHAFAWALTSDRGEVLEHGASPAGDWPAHDALELVIAAAQVRIVALQLPPLAAARVSAAARYAIEDEIAGGEATTHVGTSAQIDGKVLAVLCPRALLEPLRTRDRALAQLQHVIAEPELAAPAAEWRWCRSEERDSGFVRLPDGGAFPVSDVGPAGALPPELSVALAGAQAPCIVRVEWPTNAAHLARWEDQTHARFVQAPPFDWKRAVTPRTVVDLMQGELSLRPRPARVSVRRMFAPALWLLGAAALIELVGMAGEWISLRVDAARSREEWQALAVAVDVPREALGSPSAARMAIAHRRDEVLHAHHRFAPDDALPLLARASPAVALLPSGAMKRAVFDANHWTIEIEGVAPPAIADLESRLRAAGLDTLAVAAAGGARVRIGLP